MDRLSKSIGAAHAVGMAAGLSPTLGLENPYYNGTVEYNAYETGRAVGIALLEHAGAAAFNAKLALESP